MRLEHVSGVSRSVGASLFVGVIVLSGMASAQDAESVKASMVKSLAKIEKYPAAAMKGRWVISKRSERTGQFQFRGEKMWVEFESRILDQPADAQAARLKAARETMGSEGLLHTSEFDGKKLYDFNPYDLTLRVQTMNRLPMVFSGLPLLPKNWLYMGGQPTQAFARFVGDADYDVTVEELGGGRWKLSQSDLGSRLPAEVRSKFVGVKDRYIIVDEKCDFLVAEYYGKGAKVEVSGTLEWASQDGNWYVKHGKQLVGTIPYAEWFIDEITFDAAKCRDRFDDLLTAVPDATQINTCDEHGQRLSQTYKSGKAGEAEHQRRRLAWQKREAEGFK